jgi:hypothetical protein
MPPIVAAPLLRIALGAIGSAVVIRWVVKEVRRVNAELERIRAASNLDRAARERLPKLRRDPRTGDWRVM